jgi:hypothetical protein
MIQALRAGEIDVGIGLTEGWIAGLGKKDSDDKEYYRLVGTYVQTPLCESISPEKSMLLACEPPSPSRRSTPYALYPS